MTTTAECTLEVPLIDFRRAIASVRPHAEKTKAGDELTAFQRVRFIAAQSELYVCATNGTTSALAAVEIMTDSRATRFDKDDGEFALDMSPALVSDLRAGLRINRTEMDEDQQVARVTFTDDTISAVDVSGLWPGSKTARPTLAYSADYPDLHGALSRALGAAGQAIKPMDGAAEVLAPFLSAAREYDKPLRFESTGPTMSRGFIVWCGRRFIGSVSSQHHDDDSMSRRESERRAHLERLGLQPALAGL